MLLAKLTCKRPFLHSAPRTTDNEVKDSVSYKSLHYTTRGDSHMIGAGMLVRHPKAEMLTSGDLKSGDCLFFLLLPPPPPPPRTIDPAPMGMT